MSWNVFWTLIFSALVIFLIIKTFGNLFLSWKTYRAHDRDEESKGIFTIELLRPAVFLKLFANCLTVAFFPQYLMHITLASHCSPVWTSLAFSFYQIAFVLMLIPSGFLLEVKNIKKLLLFVSFVEIFVLVAFGFAHHIVEIFILQVLFGCLIPVSSGAEYAYVFNFSTEKNRNRSIALYSNTLRGATIAGTATGGFLAYHIGMTPVFFIASGLVLCSWLYVLFFIPSIVLRPDRIRNSRTSKIRFGVLFRGVLQAIRRLDFLKLIACIGIPSGILEEGVILFCFPLFLAYYKISSTQIGQWLVLFSIGFFLTNRWVAKRADKHRIEKYFLILGLLGIAVTLLLIFLFGKNRGLHSYDYKILLIAALFMLGIFRGFLLSPAVARVSKSPIAKSLGKNVALSVYRLFETSGKIVGPLLLGQLLLILHYSYSVFLILSALYFIAALIFAATRIRRRNRVYDLGSGSID